MKKRRSASGVSLSLLKPSASRMERAWLNLSLVSMPFWEQLRKASLMICSICSLACCGLCLLLLELLLLAGLLGSALDGPYRSPGFISHP